MKIVTVIGARPQFIKAAAVSREIGLRENIEEVLLHTGQHFDPNMSDVFFEQLEIPKPKYNLEIHNLSHGAMTGKMLEAIEKVLLEERPDYVLVYGDTNSTLAGALAASKLHIPIVHVESGLRSFNLKMPEEVNRIVTDRLSSFLFCPTQTAVDNLTQEGFENFGCSVDLVGDVMLDSSLYFGSKLETKSEEKYYLATLHRQENTDDSKKLKNIIEAFNNIHKECKLICPLHPRTRKIIQENNINCEFEMIDSVGYLEMVKLIKNSQAVLTDSGGLQKEAYFFQKPCLTLREETEWVELVEAGVNFLVGSDSKKIFSTLKEVEQKSFDYDQHFYGEGKASKTIIDKLLEKSS